MKTLQIIQLVISIVQLVLIIWYVSKKRQCMAQNDFFPIVYRILAALYKNLKEDKENQKDLFNHELYDVKKKFFDYILKYIVDEEFVDTTYYKPQDNKIEFFDLSNMQITPKGIEYLNENSVMNKTKNFFQELKSSIPFI